MLKLKQTGTSRMGVGTFTFYHLNFFMLHCLITQGKEMTYLGTYGNTNRPGRQLQLEYWSKELGKQ